MGRAGHRRARSRAPTASTPSGARATTAERIAGGMAAKRHGADPAAEGQRRADRGGACAGLSPEEAALWARVTATIRPLSREPLPKTEPAQLARRPSPPPIARKPKGPLAAARPDIASRPARSAIGNTLDGELGPASCGSGAGRARPHRSISTATASTAPGRRSTGRWNGPLLNRERVLLLITGHDRRGDPPVERGRIRAAVHDWLAASRHRERIAAVRGAHRRHGGGGSLYVILRR